MTAFLRGIVLRLETVTGPVLLREWFEEAAAGTWEQDREDYERVKLLVTCVQSRTKPPGECEEAGYQTDLAKHRPAQ